MIHLQQHSQHQFLHKNVMFNVHIVHYVMDAF